MERLEDLRVELDEVDHEALILLAKRKAIIARVISTKATSGVAAHQPDRFAAMMEDRHQFGEGLGLSPELIDDYGAMVHKDSLEQQGASVSESA